MAGNTKMALAAALQQCLLEKPFNEITIQELTNKCGISRVAFYYHFKDINDLLQWAFMRSAERSFAGSKASDGWQIALTRYYQNLYENKALIINVSHSAGLEYIRNILFPTSHKVLSQAIAASGTTVSEETCEFIARFYTHAFVGIIIDWIASGMNVDYHELGEKVSMTISGAIYQSLSNYTDQVE